MGLASKPGVSEREAAAQFLLAMFLGVRDNWATISASLRPLMISAEKLEAPSTEFEFSMATIALQLRALDHVFPPDQARRIRAHVLSFLLSTEPGEAALEALKVYDGVWVSSLDAGRRPLGAMAARFCRRVGLDPEDLPADGSLADSIFAGALGDAFTTTVPGWWKSLVKAREIVG